MLCISRGYIPVSYMYENIIHTFVSCKLIHPYAKMFGISYEKEKERNEESISSFFYV